MNIHCGPLLFRVDYLINRFMANFAPGSVFQHLHHATQLLALLAAALIPPFISAAEPDLEDGIDWKKEREFWSFHSPVMPARPAVKNARWVRQDLDYYILSRLEKRGLTPSLPADKRSLLRRVTYDLTGLPPTPAQIEAFLKDKRAGSYERLVDQLLSSPAFGERMASMWLPLARYAEDQAHQVGDDTAFFYPNAYRYREWVIDAFNRDLHYQDFIRLQLAADKVDGDSTNNLPALGFLGLGPKYYNRNRLEVMADEWEDRVDTVSRTFLGLTVACARCHDHKFDPITRADYYGLAGIFASTKMVNKVLSGTEEPAAKTNAVEKAEDAAKAGAAKKKEKPKIAPSAIHMVEEDKPQDLNIFIRGNVDRKGPIAPRQFVRILATQPAKPYAEGSGRTELADAIADWNNPLTARVMVNRIWSLFFGKGLVDTPSNFGHSGSAPTNPELLDFLAVRFMQEGGSMKSLIREIVLSATYQQSSRADARTAALDPSNEFHGRMNRRRLTIEQWRDGLLAVSGDLQPVGGRSLELDDTANLRRTVYSRISRLQLNSVLMLFDYPDANVHSEKRSSTTTAMQKLFAMNSPFMLDRAKGLAGRLNTSKGSDQKRVQDAYQLVFGRDPENAEIRLALDFLARPSSGEVTRWQQYAQSLLISNEMLYVD